MMHLLLADLRTQWRAWLGVFALAATAGLVLSLGVSVAETGFVLGGEFQEGLAGMAGMILMFSTVSAIGVLSSVAALTVQLQQRSYALWQLLGARSGAVGFIVMAQLLLVALVGALLGIAAAPPLARAMFTWGFPTDSILYGIQTSFGLPTVVGTLLAVCLLVLLGGWRPARRAARTEPLEVLRESEPRGKAMGWLRWVMSLIALCAVYGISAELFVPDSDPALTPLIAPAMAAVVLFLGPFLYPLVLAAWTALIPGRLSSAWLLARHQAQHRLSYSTAAITPLFVGISLTGGLLTAAATQFKGESVAVEQLVIMLGGPILLAAVASAVVVFMSSRTREQELGLLQASGAEHRTLVLTALFEALIYVVTACLLAIVVIVVSGVVIAAGLSVSEPGTAPSFAFGAAAAVAGVGGTLVLVATLLPTALGLRKDVISALSP